MATVKNRRSQADQRVAESMSRTAFTQETRAERGRQIEKWGRTNPGWAVMIAVLTEEVGEVARALLDRDPVNMRTELIQTAAVCCRIYEQLERGDEFPKATKPKAFAETDLQLIEGTLDQVNRAFLGTSKPPTPAQFARTMLAVQRMRGGGK